MPFTIVLDFNFSFFFFLAVARNDMIFFNAQRLLLFERLKARKKYIYYVLFSLLQFPSFNWIVDVCSFYSLGKFVMYIHINGKT